jgi:hypothetical protein
LIAIPIYVIGNLQTAIERGNGQLNVYSVVCVDAHGVAMTPTNASDRMIACAA